jgi:phage-related holin
VVKLQDVEKVLLSIIPTRIEVIWGTVTGGIGTMITFLFGVWNDALTALAMFIFIDYITGVMAAYIRPKKKVVKEKGVYRYFEKISGINFCSVRAWY